MAAGLDLRARMKTVLNNILYRTEPLQGKGSEFWILLLEVSQTG